MPNEPARSLVSSVKSLVSSASSSVPKTERVNVPPIGRELAQEMTEEERARRREETAAKRRERALAKSAAFETEDVVHPVPDGTGCSKCGGTQLRHLDYETSTTFEYKPGRFVRLRHKREKKACSCGECIITAPLPPKLVARGQYGFGFVAFLIVEKCADSIPIARVEKRFARLGIPISRSTMNDLIHDAADLARPLVARLAARIAKLEVVLADETSMRLQDRAKRGFVWVFHGPRRELGRSARPLRVRGQPQRRHSGEDPRRQ